MLLLLLKYNHCIKADPVDIVFDDSVARHFADGYFESFAKQKISPIGLKALPRYRPKIHLKHNVYFATLVPAREAKGSEELLFPYYEIAFSKQLGVFLGARTQSVDRNWQSSMISRNKRTVNALVNAYIDSKSEN